MSTGLHVRKKPSNLEEDADPEVPSSPSNGDGNGSENKIHGQTSFFRRFVRSEVGCAIEAIAGFLIFGLLFGYLILHHQHRKVRSDLIV